jgi:DNA recombination protein RmuC
VVYLLFFFVIAAISYKAKEWWQKATLLERVSRDLEGRLKVAQEERETLKMEKKLLEQELSLERKSSVKMEDLVEKTKGWLYEKMQTLSYDSFSKSQNTFFALAKETFDKYHTLMSASIEKQKEDVSGVISPLKNSLEAMEKKVFDLELTRKGAYEGLKQELVQLCSTQNILQKETSNLSKALREPTVRGRWGEIQLRRVVEIAGMLPYCDFEEQVSVTTEEGMFRPDMVVRLPHDRVIVIDSKVSLSSYLDALSLDDEEAKKEKLTQHARQIRQHVTKLSQKKYWEQFQKAPDFVVLFMHGECFLNAALEYEQDLLEFASAHKVLIATPTSLIAMLKIIAYSWNEAKIEQHAHEILQEAKAWLERSRLFSEHFNEVGRHIEKTSKVFERAKASFETRLLVTLRRLASKSGLSSVGLPPPITFESFDDEALHQEKSEELLPSQIEDEVSSS